MLSQRLHKCELVQQSDRTTIYNPEGGIYIYGTVYWIQQHGCCLISNMSKLGINRLSQTRSSAKEYFIDSKRRDVCLCGCLALVVVAMDWMRPLCKVSF